MAPRSWLLSGGRIYDGGACAIGFSTPPIMAHLDQRTVPSITKYTSPPEHMIALTDAPLRTDARITLDDLIARAHRGGRVKAWESTPAARPMAVSPWGAQWPSPTRGMVSPVN